MSEDEQIEPEIRWEIYPQRSSVFRRKQWRFRARSTENGEIIAWGEGYNNLRDCADAVDLLRRPSADVIMVTL